MVFPEAQEPPIGGRVFTCIPQAGYVGIGIVTGEAARFEVATVTVENQEQKLAGLALIGHYPPPTASS